jgi:CRP/FNR family transcriptional regulator, anaerobic regulatory protein
MDMHKYSNLKKFIGRYVEFSEEEFENLLPIIKCVCLKRNEIFIAEGEVANKIAFVNKGYLRVFYNIDAEEVTRDITPLHSFATALPSFITQTPSYEIISAITDCELFVIDKQDLESLYNAFPKWERLGRRVIEDMFVDVQRRLYLFITETAEVRYKLFLKRYPDMIHDVPLKYIADYLGVKIQSLSRLRKSIEW